jgi:multiple sugar transport system substrate-binding protein
MKTSKMSRRGFLRAATATLGSVAVLPLISACAVPSPGSTQASAPGAARVPIRLSAWGDVPDKQWNEAIVADFRQVESAIEVTVEQYPGGYYDKVQANFAAGTSADVVYFQGWSWQPFADREVLTGLDDFIERDQAKALWPDIPNYNDNTKWNGSTYMSIADTGSVVMFYAKERFDAVDLPYPTEGWDYVQFQSTVEKTTTETDGIKAYGYAQAGGWNGAYARSLHWLRMNGALEWDTIVEPKKANFVAQEIIDAMQYTIVDTIAKGFCPSPDAIQGGGVTVATGRVAMTMEGPWFLAQMQGANAAKQGGVAFDVIEPPVGSTGKDETLAEVHGHTLAKTSKAPDEAWKLMKFVMSEQAQRRVAEGGRMCSTPEFTESLWVPIVQKTYNFENAKAFANAMRTGGSPIVAGAGANLDAVSQVAGTPLTTAWDKMVLGTSAAEALNEANPQLQQILDTYWAKKG